MKKIIISLCLLFGIQNIYAQLNPLFWGGSGDGYNRSSYLQANNANLTMNHGGDGDGYNKNSYLPAIQQTLYKGGDGDGWASNVIPLGPLPIELLSFTGKEINSTHILDWTTAMELNSSHFVIEHSTNANYFSELGMRDAAGNSSKKINYSFTNMHPVQGSNFYRLKMVDLDGKSKYSNVILLKLLKDNTSIVVFPNPTASMLNIEMNGLNVGTKLQIQIVDASGKLLKSDDLTFDNQRYSMDVSSYANGMYFLKIKGATMNEMVKFSISK